MKKYKTIIIGAGPAGLRCAKILAENNEDFLLLEKNPDIKRKICTGLWGITDKTNYMRLPKNLFQRKFNKVIISTKNRKFEIKTKKPFAATLNRKELSRYMLKEIKKIGVREICFNSHVSKIGKNFVVVNNKKIFFEYLVGADGSSSLVRKHLGLKTNKYVVGIQYWVNQKINFPEIHLDVDKFSYWYGWVAPHKNKFSIGIGGDPSIMPVQEMKENLNSWCKEKNIKPTGDIEGAIINSDYQGYKFENKFLIGDAAGFASALTGEGIYFAMASGEDVAKTILDKNYNPLLIKEVLKIKEKHESILNMRRINKYSAKFLNNLFISLLKLKFFREKSIELFC